MLYKYFVYLEKATYFFASHFVLHQMMILLVMVKNTPTFNIFIPTFLHCVLQKLDEVESVEIIKNHYRTNYFRARK